MNICVKRKGELEELGKMSESSMEDRQVMNGYT